MADKIERVTDYLGNEIKEGDEVCFIQVIDRQYFSKIGYFIPGTGESKEVDVSRPDTPCFRKGDYYKVFLYHGCIAYTISTDEFVLTEHIPPIWFNERTTVIAIKGKSDTEEQYLNFKNKQ